jgi:hypothetical protein
MTRHTFSLSAVTTDLRPQLASYFNDRRATFAHALRSTCHPGSVAAVLVVLLNDHVLRHVWPSWLTGKIGDFAWLVFAPLVLAALLAWLTPARLAAHSRNLGRLAFWLVGLEFALAKTVPLFHALTVRAYEFVIAWPSTLRLDPTDLIALPALWLGWRIWTEASLRPTSLPPAGWVMLSLAVVATLADAGAPDYGVHCLVEKDGNLYAFAGYSNVYVSHDGGVNWQDDPTAGDLARRDCGAMHTTPWQVADTQNPAIHYRFTSGVGIEKSTDAGQTWHLEVDLTREQARIVFQDKKYNHGYGQLRPGPLDALIDPKTQAVVVAMGQQGVLLGKPGSQWTWAAVGQYFRAQPASLYDFVSLLQTELWLGVILAVLVIGAFFWRIRRPTFRKPLTWLLALVFLVGWAAWFYSAMLMEPATVNNYGYGGVFVQAPVWLAALIGVPAAIVVSLEVLQSTPKALAVLLATAVGSAVLYLVPVFIWAAGGIPRYSTGSIYGGILIIAALFAGDRYLQHMLRRARPPEGSTG